ncbi:MAG: tRNA pseudouridine(55) synthase TruB [Treponema sp.]|nr:tRNA pseudouridine(55) synthase TruB [Treponema sp.]
MNSGIILLNKKPGITSFDALRDIKRYLGTGKVGHTGTLDKFAQGLLIILARNALRLSKYFSHCDKVYEAGILFGTETDTLDPEGNVTAKAPLPARGDVENALSLFTGEIMQSPPEYSAIHINGKRASDLAREGKAPEMKKRPVTIYKIELLSWQPPLAEILVHCSSGTYIRSLARDIAIEAGSRAHLNSLVRTKVAGFCLEEYHTETQRHGEYGEINEKYNLKIIDKEVISNLGLPWYEVNEHEVQNIRQGKPLAEILYNKEILNSAPSCLRVSYSPISAAAVFYGETLIAVVEQTGAEWKYGCVIADG